MPSQRFPEFLGWCRDFVRHRQAHSRDSRATAIKRLRTAIKDRTADWHFSRCGSYGCKRPIVENPDESMAGIFACGACGLCESHCECLWCPQCGDECRNDNCVDCERCTACCNCVRCEGCNELLGGESDRCRRCRRGQCCECSCEESEYGPAVQFFDNGGDIKFHAPNLIKRKINPSPRFVAAEIEVASVKSGNKVSEAVKKWKGAIVHDGSLPRSGFEINTAPAGGDLFIEQIDEICKALNDKNAKVNDSCGLHVHINAKDFDFYSMRRLVKIYAKCEDALYKMVAPSRRESNYCRPCGEHYMRTMAAGKVPKDVKIGVLKSLYSFQENCKYGAENLKRNKESKYHESRYYALNLHSWFYRGTIECRMFNGTTNAHKIQTWGMMWAHMLDFTLSHTDKEVDAMFAGKTATEALLKVCESSKVAERLTTFIKERIAKLGAE